MLWGNHFRWVEYFSILIVGTAFFFQSGLRTRIVVMLCGPGSSFSVYLRQGSFFASQRILSYPTSTGISRKKKGLGLQKVIFFLTSICLIGHPRVTARDKTIRIVVALTTGLKVYEKKTFLLCVAFRH
jgi:hypothetical protein